MNDYLDYLEHHGILGQKWGVRRYQNPDGSLTAEGRKRYIDNEAKEYRKDLYKNKNFSRSLAKKEASEWKKEQYADNNLKSGLSSNQKKIIVGTLIATAAVGAGVYIAQHPEKYNSAKKFVTDCINNSEIQKEVLSKPTEFKFKAVNPDIRPISDHTLNIEKKVPRTVGAGPLANDFNPNNFKWERKVMLRPDGSSTHMDVPVDKEGYATAFAKAMSERKPSDYKYWYDYMMRKIN